LWAGPDSNWGYLQSVYGLIRNLNGAANAAWLVQGLTTVATAVIVWVLWWSAARYPLKAATLSAAALIATPYAFAYDMAALAIPVAFLVKDQIGYGMLKGEKTIMIGVFAAAVTALVVLGDSEEHITFGGVQLAPFVAIALLAMAARRAFLPQSSAGLCVASRRLRPANLAGSAHSKTQVLDPEACGCHHP
jgi:hypothetical protein